MLCVYTCIILYKSLVIIQWFIRYPVFFMVCHKFILYICTYSTPKSKGLSQLTLYTFNIVPVSCRFIHSTGWRRGEKFSRSFKIVKFWKIYLNFNLFCIYFCVYTHFFVKVLVCIRGTRVISDFKAWILHIYSKTNGTKCLYVTKTLII